MSEWEAILLGVLQGITEFLPVSSSGHLAVGAHLVGYQEPNTAFDVALHGGTLLAVLGFFWRDFLDMLVSPFRAPAVIRSEGWRGLWLDPGIRGIVLLILGSIPTAIIGYTMGPVWEKKAASLDFVAVMFMINGLILMGSRYIVLPVFSKKPVNKGVLGVRILDALLIGVVQGMAVLRGISRSGSTISMGIMVGLDRETAGRFSFLLSVPAVLGALLLHLHDASGASLPVPATALVLGVLTSLVTGLFALWFLMSVVSRGKLHYFGWYTLSLGAMLLLWTRYGSFVTSAVEAVFHG